jgi:acetyl esterase/lipase
MKTTKLILSILLFQLACKNKLDTNVKPVLELKREIYSDIAYAKNHPAQKLDIYLPAVKSPFPVVVMIHGGGWVMGDKQEYATSIKTEALLTRGYAVVAINYRLSGVAKFPSQIKDVKAAIRYIKDNASVYKFNANKVGAWGTSAGGHLTALLATSADEKTLEDLSMGSSMQNSSIQVAIDWFGPTDLLLMDVQSVNQGCGVGGHDLKTSPESMLMGFEIQTKKEITETANPIKYISLKTPPIYISHGMNDCTVPRAQSQILYDALVKVKGNKDITLNLLSASGHGTGKFESLETLNLTVEFLDKYLK